MDGDVCNRGVTSASDEDPHGDEWLHPDEEAEKAFSEVFAGFCGDPNSSDYDRSGGVLGSYRPMGLVNQNILKREYPQTS